MENNQKMEECNLQPEETMKEETVVQDCNEEITNEEVTNEEVTNEEETTAKEDKASEYLERLQRLMAEFDNYRKRNEKEKLNMYDLAVSDVITDVLPLVDNFQRALKQDNKEDSFYKGVEMIYKQLLGLLEKFKIEPIAAQGEVFNPNLHNAVLHVEDETVGENVIVEELQTGYLYKERVLRHSLVKVAN
jgi:molecular chaperone GrpE